jgi:SCY1-like protein 2
MKYCILPRIKKICFETITLSVNYFFFVFCFFFLIDLLNQVRVNCLICLGKLVESLDKWIIIDEVIPLLQSIPSREPAVLMAILGIIKVAMSSSKSGGLPREILATKVIPFLVPISIETSLNLNQVDRFLFIK